jgi:hypothetical protein
VPLDAASCAEEICGVPETARLLGRYEVLHEIGRGGMAVVYLARQPELARLVALKEMHGPLAGDPQFARRFVREARIAGSLSHSNIVTIHDVGGGGTPFIAMEYLEAGSLRRFVGRLTLAQCCGVLQDVLAGLEHAEHVGVVHRDLKPENLLLTQGGRVKIADFGLAKATNGGPSPSVLTGSGQMLGTPAYMAPEQITGEAVGPWTDLYAVGCIAYELLTGRTPFHETDGAIALLHRHLSDTPRPALSINPSLSPQISDWIDQLLKKAPEDRPRSARDAWTALDEILIRVAGPRWHRGAGVGSPPTSAMPPVLRAGAPKRSDGRLDTRVSLSAPETRRAVVTRLATVGPEAPPRAAPRSLRTVSALWVLLLLALALGGGAAALALRSDSQDSGHRARTSTAAPPSTSAPRTDAAFDATLRERIVNLNGALTPLRRRLAHALRTSSQKDATRALARTFETAATAVARLEPDLAAGQATQARIVDGLRRTARAYRRLSAAAAGSHRQQWNAAAAAARRDEAAVSAVIDAWAAGATVRRIHFTPGRVPSLARPRRDRRRRAPSSRVTTTSGADRSASATDQTTRGVVPSATPSSSTSSSTVRRPASKPSSTTHTSSPEHVGGTS